MILLSGNKRITLEYKPNFNIAVLLPNLIEFLRKLNNVMKKLHLIHNKHGTHQHYD